MTTELLAVCDDNDTSLLIGTSEGQAWHTGSPLEKPYYVHINGDAMKVTSMANATPAFIAAGVVAHGNNASVVPGLPAGMTPDIAQLMLLIATIRNQGTGFPNAPSGWSRLAVGTAADLNVQVFSRFYVTGDSAPTVTFTNGVANADTSARIVGFSGLSAFLDDGTAQANSSAQNIALPNMPVRTNNYSTGVRRTNNVMFAYGWKQDDGTATPPAGFTEATDDNTTTGDDQAMTLAYRIDTAATAVSGASFTMTGGASALSIGIVFALRPIQTMTVVRDINGSAASHIPGDPVRAWRMGLNAL
jgi:hypothetical protein